MITQPIELTLPGPAAEPPEVSRLVLGIDIGGSSVKGALVDVESGRLMSTARSLPTPVPATPDAVASVVVSLRDQLDAPGVVGVAFPGVIRGGRTLTAANIDSSWIGTDTERVFAAALGSRVCLLNDADAAGLAEARFGAGRNLAGSVLMLTFGTGIGSALVVDGRLAPRFEFGHLEIGGEVAELRASAFAKVRDGLSWPEWVARVQLYLDHVDRLISPDAVIVGGAVSADHEQWLSLLDVSYPILPAHFRNDAGAIGAALFAAATLDLERGPNARAR